MRRPVLVPVPVAIISSSRNKRAVEKNHVGAGEAPRHRRRHRRGAGDIGDARIPGRDLDPDIRRGLGRGLGALALEIERNLSRRGKELRIEAAGKRQRGAGNDRLPLHQVGRQHAEHGIVRDRRERGRRGIDFERLAFAQAQQARNLVDFGAGEHHGLDRAPARCRARVQRLRSPKLLRKVGRSVDQEPVFAVGAHGKACLRARPRTQVTGPCQAACRAPTVPLWKTSPCRRAEHDGSEAPHSRPTRMRRDQNSAGR